MKIAIIGSGDVAKAMAKGLSKHSHRVSLIDSTSLLKGAIEYPSLKAEVTILCVPSDPTAKLKPLTPLIESTRRLAKALGNQNHYSVVVVSTSVPPGTTRNQIIPLLEDGSGKTVGRDFGVCVQPAYMRKNSLAADFERPWFIAFGEYDKRSGETLEKVFQKFDAPIQRLSLEEAEFQKYVHNAYNATKIAFFNEMRAVAERSGWDAEAILLATAESSEASWNPLYGLRDQGTFSGSGLGEDTVALLAWCKQEGLNAQLLQSAVIQNQKLAASTTPKDKKAKVVQSG